MRKFFPVIIGIFIGITAAFAMISLNTSSVVFGEEGVSGWDNLRAWSGSNSSWKSVFSNTATPGKDLYKFVGANLILKPETEAVRIIAQKYHLTEQEADSAIKGSITVLLNNTATAKHMTTEQVYQMQTDIRDDYASFRELFDIQQEIDTSITPTEMFANGDLQDSGFDLIYDLNMMEKILFENITDVTSGKPLTQKEGNIKSFMDGITGSTDVAVFPPFGDSSDSVGSKSSGVQIKTVIGEDGEVKKEAELKIGEKSAAIEVAGSDVCAAENDLLGALDKFDEENPVSAEDLIKKAAEGGGNGMGGAGQEEQVEKAPETGAGDGEEGRKALLPAKSDDWGQGFCGAAAEKPKTPQMLSLGGENASVYEQNPGFAVNVALCIKIEMVKQAASVSGGNKGCIQCEVEKINEAFNKTLNHSMIPNKTTGNLMESATCKKSYGSLLDLKVHIISNPLPAQPADDVMFGKNILEEWNKFVETSHATGFGRWEKDPAESFSMNYVPSGTTNDNLVLTMEAARARNTASARNDVTALNIADEGTNMMLFSIPVLNQMKEMKGYFDSYLLMYKDTVDTCNNIKNKKTIE